MGAAQPFSALALETRKSAVVSEVLPLFVVLIRARSSCCCVLALGPPNGLIASGVVLDSSLNSRVYEKRLLSVSRVLLPLLANAPSQSHSPKLPRRPAIRR